MMMNACMVAIIGVKHSYPSFLELEPRHHFLVIRPPLASHSTDCILREPDVDQRTD